MFTQKSNSIDNIIQKNKDDFNDNNPRLHHDDRFLVKLHNRFKKIISIVPYLIKVLIITIAVFILSVWLWNSYIRKDRNEITLKSKIVNIITFKK